MRRCLEREQRAKQSAKEVRLHESDYLLGVHYAFRVGALRFRLNGVGEFLDTRHGVAAPPMARLRELEAACLALEGDEDNSAAQGDDWLQMLIAPGGSLGEARPKASVVDSNGDLWIAKFPSLRDEHDVGTWELVVHTLARSCELRVPESKGRHFAKPRHTFLVKRFDRTRDGHRLHFASAMTLTGHQDGDDESTGVSYLEIAQVLITAGAQTHLDLQELWSRIIFNLLVSNTDDHLRNHGFIWLPGKGWRPSEAYDINPVPGSHGLKLNISEVDNALDLELARWVVPYFRAKVRAADQIIARSQSVEKQWRKIASYLGTPSREQDQMAPAFALAG